jgi:Uma2 family endonuclease
MTLTTAKWTIDDYHQMIESGILAGRPVELLNGEIIEMPPEGTPHSSQSTGAKEYLSRLLGERALVREGHPITILASDSEPEPDLAIVQRLHEFVEDEYWEHHPYPENIFWVIEYSDSSLKKDLEAKAKLYAAAGICEYWVINLKTMELVVMRDPRNGEYGSQLVWTEPTIRPVAFPDLEIAVGRLLRKPKAK